ncbi:MAG: peroxidase family protein, partial [Bacteroidota bacterium]
MMSIKKYAPHPLFYVVLINLLLLLAEFTYAQNKRKMRSNNQSFTHIPRNLAVLNSVACEQEEFRSIDGTCNNTSHPARINWGATDIPLLRSIPSHYSFPDPFNDLAGKNRPSPRLVSNAIVAQPDDLPSEAQLSALVFTWGQFLDHDIDLTPEGHTEYEPVILPDNEPLFTYDIPFFRSAIHEDTGTDQPRQQSNLITSWIDGSNVYGSEESRAQWLRTFVNGKLKTSSGEQLPFNTIDGEYDSPIDPNAPSMAGDEEGTLRVYVAGDVRASEQPGLTSLHTLFVREHNRICDELMAQGIMDDEKLYQQARKQVGALLQAITYRGFLPALGIELTPYNGYQPEVRPDISNHFATAAYRLGHTMVTEELLLRDDNCEALETSSVTLIDGFFNPEVVRTYNIDPILKGLS